MEEVKPKYFTPKEANKTLPLVKKIVEDILNNAKQIKYYVETLGQEAENNVNVLALAEEINSYMNELEEIGCSYKDWSFELGLVDFPSVIDNKEVLLCWRSDEDSIKYYHGLFEGFIGRKLIPDEYL
ncbi:DUF2203 domain-containing protein [Stygiobacter electus]|uniref:DUF2203 domain-containing protein n=1 Tax=Stygiobacter electus TaxID=3032292 RepID=A0AAE3P284_9BACT|nr:DUF2203 domain-containing protein [Stygiobacter electus]MDF1613034.1 DUF2203 domain-containing protein [Stygiobacter electus]